VSRMCCARIAWATCSWVSWPCGLASAQYIAAKHSTRAATSSMRSNTGCRSGRRNTTRTVTPLGQLRALRSRRLTRHASSRPRLTGAVDHILVACQLLDADGPAAWKRSVEIPISAPMPNSPPSANCVEALCNTIALSTRDRSAAPSPHCRNDRVGMRGPVAGDMRNRFIDPIDLSHGDDRVQVLGIPIRLTGRLQRGSCRLTAGSPRTSQPAAKQIPDESGQKIRRAMLIHQQRLGRPQMPVRRNFALRTMRRAISRSASRST